MKITCDGGTPAGSGIPAAASAGRLQTAAAAVLLLLVSGCGDLLLTKDQITAVNAFAAAAKGYTVLPDTVITNYAKAYPVDSWTLELQSQQIIFDGQGLHPARQPSTQPMRDAADAQFEELKRQVAFAAALQEQAKRTSAALAVIGKYAQLLQSLTSTSADGELDVGSTALAKSVDSGVQALNKNFKTTLSPTLGSTVAEVVRAAGGIVISDMQERDLKKDVPLADAAIEELTSSVDTTMKLMTDPNGLIDNLEAKLQTAYAAQFEAYRTHGSLPLPYDVILAYQQQWVALEDLRTQADQAVKAADALRRAHKTLMESLTTNKGGLAAAVEEAEAAVDQVQAGIKLKKTIDSSATTKPAATNPASTTAASAS
jgi:hypothetical protein